MLRILTGEAGGVRGWAEYEGRLCSVLVEVECLRALDRMKVTGVLAEVELLAKRDDLRVFLEGCDTAEVTRAILRRASAPLPFVLSTLDAVHLCTALGWQESSGEDVLMVTHDKSLSRAARAFGLRVAGA